MSQTNAGLTRGRRLRDASCKPVACAVRAARMRSQDCCVWQMSVTWRRTAGRNTTCTWLQSTNGIVFTMSLQCQRRWGRDMT
jgi:hypothetical protein